MFPGNTENFTKPAIVQRYVCTFDFRRTRRVKTKWWPDCRVKRWKVRVQSQCLLVDLLHCAIESHWILPWKHVDEPRCLPDFVAAETVRFPSCKSIDLEETVLANGPMSMFDDRETVYIQTRRGARQQWLRPRLS